MSYYEFKKTANYNLFNTKTFSTLYSSCIILFLYFFNKQLKAAKLTVVF